MGNSRGMRQFRVLPGSFSRREAADCRDSRRKGSPAARLRRAPGDRAPLWVRDPELEPMRESSPPCELPVRGIRSHLAGLDEVEEAFVARVSAVLDGHSTWRGFE